MILVESKRTTKELCVVNTRSSFFWCAQHGRSLTGESPECGLIVPST